MPCAVCLKFVLNCQDPKEYLPLLNELKKLPIYYQHFRIDCILRRYPRALDNISKCMLVHFGNLCVNPLSRGPHKKVVIGLMSA